MRREQIFLTSLLITRERDKYCFKSVGGKGSQMGDSLVKEEIHIRIFIMMTCTKCLCQVELGIFHNMQFEPQTSNN